jgi:chemotaxis protein MotB
MAVSRSRRHGGHEEEHENHERWLLTYADMLTLLMVLFIVMFAISQVDQKKFAALSGGLSKSFNAPPRILADGTGVLSEVAVVPPDPNLQQQVGAQPDTSKAKAAADQDADQRARAMAAARREADDLKRAEALMKAALHRKGLDNAVRFVLDERGLNVTIVTDRVLFPADLATLQPTGVRILDALAPAMRQLPNDLMVEGHTNTAPVKPRFYPTEWELSSARAVSVLRYLVERRGVSARRVAAAGFADQHPLYATDNPRANVLNRRVEIIVQSRLPAERAQLLTKLNSHT